jgi:hypothetical protein
MNDPKTQRCDERAPDSDRVPHGWGVGPPRTPRTALFEGWGPKL